MNLICYIIIRVIIMMNFLENDNFYEEPIKFNKETTQTNWFNFKIMDYDYYIFKIKKHK